MLEAAGLECERGGRTLFRKLDISAGQGDLIRVAGANGSGKTSLLRILCGLLEPGAGEVRWQREKITSLKEEYSRSLVYLGHAPAVKDDLTAVENLHFACVIAGVEVGEVESAIERFSVPAHTPVKRLSQGQKRRASLARLCVSSGIPLWFLDEPFAALDRQALKLAEDLITGHVASGGSVVYTTHQDDSLGAGRVVDLG